MDTQAGAAPPLPGSNEAATVKDAPAALTDRSTTHPATQIAPKKTPRKTRSLEDVDTDYAEEAEDFFYGEGG